MEDMDSAEADWLSVDEHNLLSGDGLSVVSGSSIRRLVSDVGVSSDSVAQAAEDRNGGDHGLGDSYAQLQPMFARHCADKQDGFAQVVRLRSEAILAHWGALLRAQTRRWKRRRSSIADGERSPKGTSPTETFNQFIVRFGLLVINRDSRLDDVMMLCREINSSLSALAASPHGFRSATSSAWGDIVGMLVQNFRQDRCAAKPAMDEKQCCSLLQSLAVLTCGRRTVQLLLNFVALLHRYADGEMSLPLRELVARLDDYREARKRQDAKLNCDSFIATRKWNLSLSCRCSSVMCKDPALLGKGRVEGLRQLTCDGSFLYVTNRCGSGLAKLGTGLNGSMRSHLYASRPDVKCGMPVCVAGHLLRFEVPVEARGTSTFDFGRHSQDFAVLVDPDLLQDAGGVELCMPHGPGEPTLHTNATLRFISDGTHVLWIWARNPGEPPSVADGNATHKTSNMPLDVFVRKLSLVQGENGKWTLVPVTEPLFLDLPYGATLLVDRSGATVDITKQKTLPAVDVESSSDDQCYFELPSPPWTMCLRSKPVFTNGHTLSVALPSTTFGADPKSPTRAATMLVTVSLETGRLLSVGNVSGGPGCGLNPALFRDGLDCAASFEGHNNCVWTMNHRVLDQWSHVGCPVPDTAAMLLRNSAAPASPRPAAAVEGRDDVSVAELKRAVLDYLQLVIPDQVKLSRAFEWLDVASPGKLLAGERVQSEFGLNVLELYGKDLNAFFADLENGDFAMADTFLSLTRAYGCCPVSHRDDWCTARLGALLEQFAELNPADDRLAALRRIAIDTLWSQMDTFYPKAARRGAVLRAALGHRLSATEAGDRADDDDYVYSCVMRELRLDLDGSLSSCRQQQPAPDDATLSSVVKNDSDLVDMLFSVSVNSVISAMHSVQSVPADRLQNTCRHEPVVAESTRVLVALTRNTMSAVLPLDTDKAKSPLPCPEPTEEQLKGPTVLIEKVYSSCLRVLTETHACMERMKGDAQFDDRCSLARRLLFASLVGQVAPLITSVLSHPRLQSCGWSETVLAAVIGTLLEIHKLCDDIANMNGPAKPRKTPSSRQARGQDAANADVLSPLLFSTDSPMPRAVQEQGLEPEPFLAELGLSLMEMLVLHIACLFRSPPVSESEAEHAKLYLESPALRRCVWAQPALPSGGSTEAVDSDASWLGNMKTLRGLAGKPLPMMRPSIAKLLDVPSLDAILFRVFSRHFRLMSHVQTWTKTKVCPAMLAEALRIVFGKINELFRKIQAVAEIENSFVTEVCEYEKGNEMFFHRFEHEDGGAKQLRLLCSVADVPFESNSSVKDTVEQLEKLIATRHDEWEKLGAEEKEQRRLPVTELIPGRIGKCCEMLLCIPLVGDCTVMDYFDRKEEGKERAPDFWRSVSAPTSAQRVTAEQHLSPSRTLRKCESLNRSGDDIAVAKATMQEFVAKATTNADELMAVIGNSALGNYQADCKGLNELLERRAAREKCRKSSLAYMTSVVARSSLAGAGSDLVSKIINLLRKGPRYGELMSTAGISAVRQIFGRLLASLVQLLETEERINSVSAAQLCTIPFVREDAEILASSGLLNLCGTVFLSDRFGGLSTHSPVAAVWIGFQMLVHRVLAWEVQEDAYSGPCKSVARVIGEVIAGLLGRAPHLKDEVSYGALNSVLGLLLAFSKNGMGCIILSQPGCVTKLLSLLCDHRPSPNLVLMVLQLCRVALPLMSMADCRDIRLPASLDLASSAAAVDSSPSSRIVMLLLFKLGDYIVPSAPYTVESAARSSCRRTSDSVEGAAAAIASSMDASSMPAPSSPATLYLHIQKCETRQSNRVVHQFWEYFYVHRSDEMASMINISSLSPHEQATEVSRHGRVLLLHGTHALCTKVAADLAIGGFALSVQKATDSDKRVGNNEAMCLQKNVELTNSTSLRPFISGNAANIMAAEVIGLLHALMMTKDKEAAEFWLKAINEAFNKGLNATRHIVPLLVTIANDRTATESSAEQAQQQRLESRRSPAEAIESVAAAATTCSSAAATSALRREMRSVRLAIAVLGALGGLAENVCTGTRVEVVGEATQCGLGTVRSVSDQQCSAVVEMDAAGAAVAAGCRVEVPLDRLIPPISEPLPLDTLDVTDSFLNAIFTLLSVKLNAEGVLASALATAQCYVDSPQLPPPQLSANSAPRAAARLLAQLKTRASCALAYHVATPLVYSRVRADRVLYDYVMASADLCRPGSRLSVTEEHCNRLRMVYRDCSRPPPPRQRRRRSLAPKEKRLAKPVRFDLQLLGHQLPCYVFSEEMTTARRTGNEDNTNPVPALVLAAPAVPKYASSYYFEVVCREVWTPGTNVAAECPFMFGFTTLAADKRTMFAVGWNVQVFTQASGEPAQSIPLPMVVNRGDTFGIGWQRNEGGRPSAGADAAESVNESSSEAEAEAEEQQQLGDVYFTFNGERLEQQLSNVCISEQHPCVDLLKKDVIVHCNFGEEKFLYLPGQEARAAADACSSVVADIADIVATLMEMAFFDSPLPDVEDAAAIERQVSDSGSSFYTPESRASPVGEAQASVNVADAAAGAAVAGGVSEAPHMKTLGVDFQLPPAWRSDQAVLEVTWPGGVHVQFGSDDGAKESAESSVSGVVGGPSDSDATTAAEKPSYRPVAPDHPSLMGCRPAMLHTGRSISASSALGLAQLAKEDRQDAKEREAAAAAAAAEANSRTKRAATMAAPDVEQAPSSDLNELLVACWEKKVFNIIKSRFRNNDERRQGLQQITGALRMGMIDIAIQTVEFLYDEGGGMPPNLQFPTLETVKADMNKFDINRVRKGGVVLIGPEDTPAQDGTAASTSGSSPRRGGAGDAHSTGTKLPAFATPAMADTIGLVGAVMNIDKVNHLVELEVYVREEGVLASFWYPSSFLRRAPAAYQGANDMRSPEDMTNDVHRQLVCCESTLSSLHCRTAMITILLTQASLPTPSTTTTTNTTTTTTTTTPNLLDYSLVYLHPRRMQLPDTAEPSEYTAIARDGDDNSAHDDDGGIRLLTYLSEHLLVAPCAAGLCPNVNLTQCFSPRRCLSGVETPLAELLYVCSDPLRATLQRLFDAPAAWPVFVDDVMASLGDAGRVRSVVLDCGGGERDFRDVRLDGAAAIVVSCERDDADDSAPSEPQPPPTPGSDENQAYARIFAHDPQLGLRHDGQPQLREVVRYPNVVPQQSSSSGPGAYCGPKFPTVIIPGDRVHVRIHGNAPRRTDDDGKFRVRLTSIPAALPLALLFADNIVQRAFYETADVDASTYRQCVHVMLQCVDTLLAFLTRTDYPPAIRESMLLRLSALLVGFCFSDWQNEHRLDDGVIRRLLSTLDGALVPMLAELGAFGKQAALHRLSDVATVSVERSHCRLPDYARALLELVSTVPLLCQTLDVGIDDLRRFMPGFSERAYTLAPRMALATSKLQLPPPFREVLPWVDSLLAAFEMILMQRSHTELRAVAHVHGGGLSGGAKRRHRSVPVPRFLPAPSSSEHRTLLARNAVASSNRRGGEAFSQPLLFFRFLLVAGITPRLTTAEVAATLRSLAKRFGGLRSLLVPSRAEASEHVRVGGEMDSSVDVTPELQPCCGFAVLELGVVGTYAELVDAVLAERKLRCPGDQPGGKPVSLSSLEEEIDGKVPGCHDCAVQYLLLSKLFDGDTMRARATDAIREVLHNAAEAEMTIASSPHSPNTTARGHGGPRQRGPSTDEPTSSSPTTPTPSVSRRFVAASMRLPMHKLLSHCCVGEATLDETIGKLYKEHGVPPAGGGRVQGRKKKGGPHSYVLCEVPFVRFMENLARSEPRRVWKGLLAAGYDFDFELSLRDPSELRIPPATEWTPEMDAAIVRYGNRFAQDCGIPAKRLSCQDFVLTDAQLRSDDYALLAGCSRQEIVVRAEMLLYANSCIAPFLPLVDLRTAHTHLYSLAATLLTHRSRLFYSTKTEFLNAVLNASAIDKLEEMKRPEILLNPLNKVGDGSGGSGVFQTQFVQAAEQLASTPSTQYHVAIASGGDPTYGFQVRFTGDDVLGTSGSFRHFLWTVAEELRSMDLSLLEECHSAASGRNKAKYTLCNRPMSCSDERNLQFFGQLLGIVMRADLPLPLDLLPSFWKTFLRMQLDMSDLKEADIVTYQYITDIGNAKDEHALRVVLNPDAAADDCDDVDFLGGEWRDAATADSPSTGAAAAATAADVSDAPTTSSADRQSQSAVASADPCPRSSAWLDHGCADRGTAAMGTESFRRSDSVTEAGDEESAVEEGAELYNSLGQVVMFTYELPDGGAFDLCPGGATRPLTYANRDEYVRLVRDHRLGALACVDRMAHVRAGFASVVPLHSLSVMSPQDMQLRICGQSTISLEFLKGHTSYQTGIDESNPHIRLFWQALESFSEDELSRFIKFASNQERLPVTCPCQSNPSSQHVPPYPMKIGPADGDVTSNPDQRYLRAETCMFLVKLPLYSTLDVMRDKMLHAIHCRDDPLSG